MILKHMREKFNADTDHMKHEMPSVINVLQCYGGDCGDCAEKSAGTCAGGDSDNRFVRSRSLRQNGITALHPFETDIQTMPEILLVVLGDEGIEKTWGLSTTQSNEAANRALSSRCPKNVKFSKSITARLGSAILTCNDSPGDAQRKKSHRLGLPMSRGQKRYHAAEQKRNTYS